jgi:hypothetical protein
MPAKTKLTIIRKRDKDTPTNTRVNDKEDNKPTESGDNKDKIYHH